MTTVNHFAQGPLTLVIAYAMSCVGSVLGLRMTVRAHASTGVSRNGWLVGAAISIGGTGIWTMHFIAMMGFEVEGTQIKYDVPLTIASALVSIVVVGAGLFLVFLGRGRTPALLGGGLLTGLGVAGMHYMGMYAMNMSAHVSYDPPIVVASVIIAIVAATVALWFTLRVRRLFAITGAALIMGAAVSGMHYTGMYAMIVELNTEPASVSGVDAFAFLVPLAIVIAPITMVTALLAILTPSEKEMVEDAALMASLEEQRNRAGGHHGSRPPSVSGGR
ncbi:MHYT domain-containing protein [Sphaerisporangium perillae]|uniref:MHYT domain-containing protein n=1 Tax=Sphaerisporangium perillae TaxID=2935860 RepID=UPI00200C5A0B|nr:MHYT domain-containing protein [Sphaerisporangium perillae]